MTAVTRILGPADADAFRALRLEALRLAPEAFGAAHVDEAGLPLSAFRDRLAPPAPGAVFGAWAGAALRGMTGLRVDPGEKTGHKGLVWGVFVRPAARGQGLSGLLLAAVVAHARAAGLERLHLAVGTSNAAARRLYDAAGFRLYGIERQALRLGPGQYVDEELRVLSLA
jgi:ribosomal protein S18 acetylase RimI-like enzyme